jgi:hypothetical protein
LAEKTYAFLTHYTEIPFRGNCSTLGLLLPFIQKSSVSAVSDPISMMTEYRTDDRLVSCSQAIDSLQQWFSGKFSNVVKYLLLFTVGREQYSCHLKARDDIKHPAEYRCCSEQRSIHPQMSAVLKMRDHGLSHWHLESDARRALLLTIVNFNFCCLKLVITTQCIDSYLIKDPRITI